MRAGWGRLGDVQALCPEQMPKGLYAYHISIGDGFVYPQDVGYCFDFYAPIPTTRSRPSATPGGPPTT
ncbi:MAG: hypothetical protein H0T76_12635 [Nannocystis sp.]|nr:hypothetical protein [Nannocystis sp.]MBA3547325.1 hypothetical protein [Nannocystis sp.]